MRIRSIKPEFWRSDDIAALDWDARLVFIGLWSYVDDNGVGRDDERIITAELFALDGLTESSVRVHGALQTLTAAKLITRYTVDGKRYLHVTTFSEHQVINRPSKPRYPLPTRDDAVFTEDSVSVHGAIPEHSLRARVGTGEQGSREQGNRGAADTRARARLAPVEPPDDDSEPPGLTEQTLAEFAVWCDQHQHPRPTRAVRDNLGRHIAELLAENVPITDIRSGLIAWQTKGGTGPGALPGFVHEIRSRHNGKPRRQTETDTQFERLLARAAEKEQKAISQ